MILIPELEKILILVPRAGSTSLKDAVLKKWPNAIMLYRHMEADGVPMGYDNWEKVGIVRHPVARLWSLYNYLRDFGLNGKYENDYAERMRNSVANRSFDDWLINNSVVFTTQYYPDFRNVTPKYTIRHQVPENIKSQYITLRPDLGTRIFRMEDLKLLANELDVVLEHKNAANKTAGVPAIGLEATRHIQKHFAWDLEQYE